MAGLGERVLALFGGRRKGPGLAGWVRLDADNVVRGWVSDPADLARRLSVRLVIDGGAVAAAVADRLDPKLVELGHGDGRHAFEILLPAAFRDGASHRFEAVEPQSGYRLMSKADAFTVPRGAAAPRLRIESVSPDGVRGTLEGGQYGPEPTLELWSGGERLPVDQATWRARGRAAEFHLHWTAELFHQLGHDAEIAAPGMHEGAPGAGALRGALRLRPWLDQGGLRVGLQGQLRLPEDSPAEVRLVEAEGGALAVAPLTGGVASLPVEMVAAGGGRELQLWWNGRRLPFMDAPIEVAVGQLVRNPGFEAWDGDGPEAWTLAAGADVERGAYAFPPSTIGALRTSADFVRLTVPAAADPVLLAQPFLQAVAAPGLEAKLRLVARASAPTRLSMVLDGQGEGPIASLAAELTTPWAWVSVESTAPLAQDPATGVQVRMEGAGAECVVDVALASIGGDGPAAEADARRWGLPDNLVVNGDLADWPHGLAVEVGTGRVECAAGWFVQNRKAPAPVRVRAWTGGEGFGLLVAAPAVSEYCRLEARLHPETLRAGPRLRIAFRASIPGEAPAAFGARRSQSVVERVFLFRRGRKPAGAGYALAVEVLGTVARRVVVEREPTDFSFDLDLSGVGPGALIDPDLFLAFDFNDPFAMLLSDVAVRPAPDEPASRPALALEDAAVTVQAATLKGLETWLSATPVQPGARFAPAAPASAPAPTLRWTAQPAAAPTVEVVVCVHDAADEALACLSSLLGATGVPHTVRIIDDASGNDTRNRLLAFIADKPWMRMISNPENRGYTASANLGVRGSAADWVILLNSDTVVTPGWIEGLLECAASDPAIGLVGPVTNAGSYQSVPELKDRQGRWKVNALPPGWSPERMAAFVAKEADKGFPHVPLLNGFCTLIRRDAFLSLGGLNEAAFPQGYGEENDLCVRAVAAGHRLAVADHVYVFHAKSASFGAGRRAELQKAAGKALAELHPDVDFTALGDRIREAAPLVNLRARVRTLYEAEG